MKRTANANGKPPLAVFELPESIKEGTQSMRAQTSRKDRKLALLVAAGIVLGGSAALAQSNATPATDKTAPVFDVVTIKPADSNSQYVASMPIPTGYSNINAPLARVIAHAYLGVLRTDRVKGAPAWVMNTPYDIAAKADEATIQTMKGMNFAQQLSFITPMLRAMLEDRFKLVAHTAPVEVQGYALLVSRHGLKMKETPPGEPLPENGMSLGGSWKVVARHGADGKQSGVAYFQITMAELASALGNSGTPVADQTGLIARYDFELPFTDAVSLDGADGSAQPPPLDIAHKYDWDAIGLEMKPVKASLLTVVIDHIERPSAN